MTISVPNLCQPCGAGEGGGGASFHRGVVAHTRAGNERMGAADARPGNRQEKAPLKGCRRVPSSTAESHTDVPADAIFATVMGDAARSLGSAFKCFTISIVSI